MKHGSVRYDEKAVDGARPGTIRIEGIEGVFRDLANDPKVQAERSCTAELHCLLAAKGPTALSMRYDLSAPQLKLDDQGTIGSMDLSALNELLVNLMGIRVKSGVVDTTWFDFHVENEMATGQMRTVYHDLDAEIMDKVTLESDFSDMTKTFLGGIKIHGSNPHDEGQSAKTISIRRTRTPETGFIKFLGENVRAGVYETVGV